MVPLTLSWVFPFHYQGREMANESMELVKGTVDVLILKTLSWKPMHGFAISEWISDTTGGDLGLQEGALYKALHRLERKGWIAGGWGLSENNRRAKYYRLTARGRAQLKAQSETWRRYSLAVSRVLEAGAL
jgi:PadR family transcriptional regulator PadR